MCCKQESEAQSPIWEMLYGDHGDNNSFYVDRKCIVINLCMQALAYLCRRNLILHVVLDSECIRYDFNAESVPLELHTHFSDPRHHYQ